MGVQIAKYFLLTILSLAFIVRSNTAAAATREKERGKTHQFDG